MKSKDNVHSYEWQIIKELLKRNRTQRIVILTLLGVILIAVLGHII